MTHFLRALIDPTAVLMLFVLLYALSVHAVVGFRQRTGAIIWPILWVILAVVAFIAWAFIVFS